jgi:hypothetical protein
MAENTETEIQIPKDFSPQFREGNIALVLDSYDDLFSDFDPRPFSERTLSDDFLLEFRRAVRHSNEGIELRFLVPKKKRNLKSEFFIKKRLRAYFQNHLKEKQNEIRNIKLQGFFWILLGMIITAASTLFYENRTSPLFDVLLVLAQPAGWFSFWEGLGKIFILAKEKKPDLDFYKKVARANIFFTNY